MKIFTSLILVLAFPSYRSAMAQKQLDVPRIIKLTVGVTKKAHIRPLEIDKDFCSRWIAKYIDSLDPAKLYFLGEDISEFDSYANQLFDLVKTSDLSFYELVLKRFDLRAQSSLKSAIERLDKGFDYSIRESIPLDYADWPNTRAERSNRWRLQLKYDLLVERFHRTANTDPLGFVRSRYQSTLSHCQSFTDEQKLKTFLDAFCSVVDHRHAYITPSQFQSFRGSFVYLNRNTLRIPIAYRGDRAVVRDFNSTLGCSKDAQRIIGREVVAIRSITGTLHHVRGTSAKELGKLVTNAFGKDKLVTLEMFDPLTHERYAVCWPRLPNH